MTAVGTETCIQKQQETQGWRHNFQYPFASTTTMVVNDGVVEAGPCCLGNLCSNPTKTSIGRYKCVKCKGILHVLCAQHVDSNHNPCTMDSPDYEGLVCCPVGKGCFVGVKEVVVVPAGSNKPAKPAAVASRRGSETTAQSKKPQSKKRKSQDLKAKTT